MDSGRPSDGGAQRPGGSPRRSRRGRRSVANEEGLRALGRASAAHPPAPADGGARSGGSGGSGGSRGPGDPPRDAGPGSDPDDDAGFGAEEGSSSSGPIPDGSVEGQPEFAGQPDQPELAGQPDQPALVAQSNQSAQLDQSGPVANEQGLLALGAQIDGTGRGTARRTAHGARRRPRTTSRRRRRIKWTIGIIAAVIILAIAAIAGDAWYLNHKIHRIAVGGLIDAPAKGADVGTENILLIGSTSRCALTVQNPAYGLCSQGVTGVNSDVVMILHLNPSNHAVSILSIPRDLFIPNARADGANKIDAGLVEGPTQLIHAIEEDFGIPIQHFVELNFDSFANVVDALGGISMYFPEEVYDAYSGLNIRSTGCVHLNGTQALQVVRARHLQYKGPSVTSSNPAEWPQEAQSDLARIRRDHEFLRVLATAVQKQGLGDPLTDQHLISSVAGQLVVDQGMSATHMISLVLAFHGVNVGSAPQLTIPVLVDQFGTYYYEGGNYGDVEFPTQPVDTQVVDQFLGLGAGVDTLNGGVLPAPSAVQVSVENGTGAANQATTTSASLKALGFNVVGVGDTPSVGAYAETVVYYSARTPALEAAAQTVVNSISGSVIMAMNPAKVTNGAQVTVVTGTNFSVNSPAPVTTTTAPAATTTKPAKGTHHTTTTIAAPTTTTTTTPPSNGAFSAATASVEALQPWDPRSCTPSGGEGT
jgi:LCP family protein required for cell wall assembly